VSGEHHRQAGVTFDVIQVQTREAPHEQITLQPRHLETPQDGCNAQQPGFTAAAGAANSRAGEERASA
jgi:hypothetical protein